MRVAFFHNLPTGGGKRSAYEWVKRMAERHEVDLYLYDPRAEGFFDTRPLVNKTVLVGDASTATRGPFGRLLALNQVRRLSSLLANKIDSGGYDLAFVMQCRVSNSPFLLRYLKTPSLYLCHEPLTRMLEPHYPSNWKSGFLSPLKMQALHAYLSIDRKNAASASSICTSSLYSRESLYKAYGLYPRLNYPGVDHEKFQPLHEEREAVVLSVGSLNPSKGHDFVIRSVGLIQADFRPKVKIIYSSEHHRHDYRGQLMALAAKLGVSVVFDSLITDQDLIRAYNSATITACPNLLEPLGLVALESMACGTPVVGVAEAGVRETVQHGENGLLTERDPHEFGRAIVDLIRDKPMWSRMSQLGRERVLERWTWDKSFEKLDANMSLATRKC
jgi:glycosyltransferase involved in cell wall biosynthesis